MTENVQVREYELPEVVVSPKETVEVKNITPDDHYFRCAILGSEPSRP